MKKPLLSIIVPVYNAEKYLNRCIESIINQTYKNLELILVDDGSVDKSPVICDDWAKKDSRVIVIHKKNGGVSSARNVGLEIATGDYIGFVDNDDFCDTDMFEFLIENLLAYNADISRCSFRYYYVSDNTVEDAEVVDKVVIYNNNDDMLVDLYNFGFKSGVLWNRIFKKSVVNNVFLNPELKSGGEDILFNYYALKKCNRMVCYDIPKYNYVMHDKNGIHGVNFNYFMYKAMKEIINDEDSPLCMYYKYYTFAYMTLHDIVVNKQHGSFSEIRKDIIKHRKEILSTSQIKDNPHSRLRLELLRFCPILYKTVLKVKHK